MIIVYIKIFPYQHMTWRTEGIKLHTNERMDGWMDGWIG